MPDVRSGSILAQILRAAAAPPGSAGRPPEHLVVDHAPHNAQLNRTSGVKGSQDCRGIARASIGCSTLRKVQTRTEPAQELRVSYGDLYNVLLRVLVGAGFAPGRAELCAGFSRMPVGTAWRRTA